jgi:glutamate synthase domain-containing protein 2
LIRPGHSDGRSRISQAEIVKRFATGAMSLGSISTEAHTTLAWP